jgi:hypothetical protein
MTSHSRVLHAGYVRVLGEGMTKTNHEHPATKIVFITLLTLLMSGYLLGVMDELAKSVSAVVAGLW